MTTRCSEPTPSCAQDSQISSGRVPELPRMPVLPHLLPDITFTCNKEELGNGKIKLWAVLTFLDRLKVHTVKPKETKYFSSPEGFSPFKVMTAFIMVCMLVISIQGQSQPQRVISQLLDIIHYVERSQHQGMTLEEAKRTLDMSLPSVVLKATRYSTGYSWICVCVHISGPLDYLKDIPELVFRRPNGWGISTLCVSFMIVKWLCQFRGSCASHTVQTNLQTSLTDHSNEARTECLLP